MTNPGVWPAIVLAISAVWARAGRGDPPFRQEVVAADHEIASLAGAEILAAGGNAVDAAVATSFALSVVRPYSCGIGGGGFMVICMPEHPELGRVETAICYRERAPRAVGPNYYENLPDDGASRFGGTAAGVPGTVAGLLMALEKYGTMDRATVLAPAIRAAEDGFPVDAHYLASTRSLIAWYREVPVRQVRFSFVWERYLKEGEVRMGDRIANPEQARALRLIAEEGAPAFYEGEIARALLRSTALDGALMTAEDLASALVIETAPLEARFMEHRVLTMPPPSSGGIAMAQVLGMLDSEIAGTWRGEELEGPRPDLRREAARRVLGEKGSAAGIHRIVEAMKHAFADRARWLGDSLFVDVPWGWLTSPDYIRARAALFDPSRTLAPERYGTTEPPPDDGGTSHLSVVDSWGNAVACTETINLEFGSLRAVEEFGFVLNNEMDDFLTRRGEPNAFGLTQSVLNLPEGRKAPLSSMTPTIVLDAAGDVRIVAGASGGPRIITGTIQAMLHVLVYDASALDAVSAPRFHHQWMPDVLRVEAGIPDSVRRDLSDKGHKVEPERGGSNVQLIRRIEGGWDAGCDPRKGGVPAGR